MCMFYLGHLCLWPMDPSSPPTLDRASTPSFTDRYFTFLTSATVNGDGLKRTPALINISCALLNKKEHIETVME